MHKIILIMVLSGLLGILPVRGQTRFLPHITDINSDFQTWLIVENIGSEPSTFQVQVYAKDGSLLPSPLGGLQPGEVQILEQIKILGSDDTSHFLIGSDNFPSTNFRFSIAYGLKSGEGSPAYIPEMTDVAQAWRLFAGNWPKVYDSIAVVNFGEQAATITVVHRALDGSVIKEVVITQDAAPLSKTVYVIGGTNSVFDLSMSPVFDIESDQNIGVIALQGDLPDSQYLWLNPTRAQSQDN